MAYDVFISYAHEEVSVARRLSAALVAARGWSVWWDTSLRTGEQYPRSIQNAVGDSRSVVVLWSKNSTTCDWVVAEASEGWNRKVLVSVLLDDSEPPLPFRQTQARNLSRWKDGLRDPRAAEEEEEEEEIAGRSIPAQETECCKGPGRE